MTFVPHISVDLRGNVTESALRFNAPFSVSVQSPPYAANDQFAVTRCGVELQTVSVSCVTNAFAYDALGRKVATTDGRGNTTRTEYNALGQQTAAIDALGNRTEYAYDEFGSLASVTDPLGNATVYEYDLQGRKTYEGGATYPVRYTYDIFGNLATLSTTRDPATDLSTFQPFNFSTVSWDTTTWLYDESSGAMTNKVYADGKGPTYDYTPNGRLSRRTWARGITTDYAYDGWGNLTNTAYSDDTQAVSLSYDAMGRQIEAQDAAGTTTFAYDAFGSITSETVIGVAGTNTIERHWDSFGRTAGYSLNGLRQTMIGYDSATGRIASMLAAGSDAPFAWSYLPGSDLKSSLAYPSGLTASWQYDGNNQLLQVCNATPTNVISQYDYTYDAAGRRVSCVHSGSIFKVNDTISYGYNIRGELTNAVAAVDSGYRYSYQYDDIGNRRWSLENTNLTEYVANFLNQYTSISNFMGASSIPDVFFPQYDDDGNQTLIQTETGIWSVEYNGENRPVLWSSGTTNIVMSYDRMGRRVEKNGARFSYDGFLQIADNEGNEYVWDPTEPIVTRPFVWKRNWSLSYYAHDGNKNVSDVVGLAVHYRYSPFGCCLLESALNASPWKFSSESYDGELKLYYYNFRHYNACNARWTTRDPVYENGFMMATGKLGARGEARKAPAMSRVGREMDIPYLFAWNDSCNHTDELGEFAQWLAACGTGCTVGALGGFLGSLGDAIHGNWRGVACSTISGAVSGCCQYVVCTTYPIFCIKGSCICAGIGNILEQGCKYNLDFSNPCQLFSFLSSVSLGCITGGLPDSDYTLKLVAFLTGLDVSAITSLCSVGTTGK